MVLRYLILLILTLLVTTVPAVQAQTVISGMVRDAVSGGPLSGATVQVENGLQATVTTEEGKFEITLSTLPATIHIGAIGYTSQRVLIDKKTSALQNILLVPAVYDLEPVIVTEHESVADIMRRVIERKQQWRARLRSIRAEAYSRFTLENEKSIVFILEGLADVSWDHTHGWQSVVKSYRRTSNMFSDDDLDDLKTLDDLAADVLVTNLYDDNINIGEYTIMGVTHPDALSKYDFSIEGQRLLDDRLVYDISVKPKSRLFVGFVGRISVLDGEYAMIEADLRPGPAFLFPPPIREFNVTKTQQFVKFDGEFWLPVAMHMYADMKVGIIGFVFPRLKVNLNSRLSNYQIFRTPSEAAADTLPPPVKPPPNRVVQVLINDSLLVREGMVIPLTEREKMAFDTIDSTVTFLKAFEPQGFIANQLKKRGVFDEEKDGDESLQPSMSGRRRRAGNRIAGPQSRLRFDFTPEFWYNRVDAAHLGLSAKAGIPGTLLTIDGTGAYNTGTKRWAYGGGGTLQWGRQRRHALSAHYMNGSETRYESMLYTPRYTSLVMLLGGEDYFDYFLNERVNMRLSSRVGRRRRVLLSGGLNFERHRSLPKTTDYALFGIDHLQRPNPAVTPGDLRSVTLRMDYGRKPEPYSPERFRYFSVETEISHPDLLSSDYSFTRTRLAYAWRINTLFKRRMFPTTLDVRMVGGFSTGTIPPQRFGILDGSLSVVTQYGVFRSLRQRPYEGTHYAGLFWEHNFRTIPFELLRLTPLARRGIGISVYGGHGRTWISGNRLSALNFVPQYQNQFHHEVGASITGLLYFFRLDFTKRLDASGFFVGIGLGPSFMD